MEYKFDTIESLFYLFVLRERRTMDWARKVICHFRLGYFMGAFKRKNIVFTATNTVEIETERFSLSEVLSAKTEEDWEGVKRKIFLK